METSPPPQQPADLSPRLYDQLVVTLISLLPPPLDDSPQALRARNHAAVAKVAALLPVDANELDLAVQCIAARAQAEETLRLVRQQAGDIALVMRLNAQYASMIRTSLSLQGRLMRMQAIRQKREAIEAAASEDAQTRHLTERSMLTIIDRAAEPPQAAAPEAAPVTAPDADQKPTPTVSETAPNSHDTAFETPMSQQRHNRASGPTRGAVLYHRIREAMAKSPPPKPTAATNGRQTPATPP